jgi:hypothetical protein
MKEVFLLGAGFSKAVHSSMPDLKELSSKVRERCENRGNKLPPPLPDLENNIELWLTYLSQSQPWLTEYYNLQNRALFLHMTEIIRQVLNETTREAVAQDCPEWLYSLIKWWHKNTSSVITFNYDTLIERVVLNALKDVGIGTQDIYPVSFTNIMSRRFPIVGDTQKDSFRLFKLHGSVNWYYSGAPSFHGEVLYYGSISPWGEVSEWENQSISEASDKVPLIVPPTSEKTTYFQHETLRQIWLKASASLSAATHVYCIGYSLPVTDLGIRFFLQHGRPQEKISLVIVNKDSEVVEHYQKLLGNSYNIDGKYAATGIEGLVKDLN